MATIVSWNGLSYTVPATGEENWGGTTKVDGLLVSLAQNSLQKTGGTFTLSADVDFGSSAGLKSAYYKTRASNPSSAGVVRLASAESVGWRNNANSGNLLLTTNASDQLVFNGGVIGGSLTASRAMVTDGSGNASASSVTSTELGRLSGILSSAVGISDSQTLTNKTLTTPIMSTITVGAFTVTLPGATDTLVGKATTDTLTNKSLTDPSVAGGRFGISGSKTTTYAFTGSGGTDTTIPVDATSGGFTVSLPALGATVFGKIAIIKRLDQTLANAVTVDPNASETIETTPTTAKLMTMNECMAVQGGGGSNTTWRVLWRYFPSNWIAYTPTITGCGTVTVTEAFWKRVGDSIQIRGLITCGTVSAAALKISLPTGLTAVSANNQVLFGQWASDYTGAAMLGIVPIMLAADTSNVQLGRNNSTSAFTPLLGNAILSNGSIFSFAAQVQITNWEG